MAAGTGEETFEHYCRTVGLDPADRARFQIEVAQRAEMLRDFYSSTTWKVGQAVVALPQAVRDKLASARRKRG